MEDLINKKIEKEKFKLNKKDLSKLNAKFESFDSDKYNEIISLIINNKIKEVIVNERNEKLDMRLSFFDEIFIEENVTFIKTQRIVGGKIPAIEEQASFLSNLIQIATKKSAEISQVLDSTFPSRLFEQMNNDDYKSNELINERLTGLQQIRERYIKNGLINSDEIFLQTNFGNFGNEYNKVLDLYIVDALEKLSPYEDLYKKTTLFINLLNQKMLAFKKIKISEKDGFYFQSDNGEQIKLSQLSSGEQNQIVIYFDLIFKTERNALVLIDEPEISLHVAWQKEFLTSINKIKEINSFS